MKNWCSSITRRFISLSDVWFFVFLICWKVLQMFCTSWRGAQWPQTKLSHYSWIWCSRSKVPPYFHVFLFHLYFSLLSLSQTLDSNPAVCVISFSAHSTLQRVGICHRRRRSVKQFVPSSVQFSSVQFSSVQFSSVQFSGPQRSLWLLLFHS